MNKFSEKFHIFKIKRLLRGIFNPDKKFIEKSRAIFLKAFKEKPAYVTNSPVARNYYKFKIAFVSVLVLLLLAVTSFVYADVKNVGPNHPLYPLKRLSEGIQMELASSKNKAQLNDIFAKRRLEEVKELKENSGQNQKNENEIMKLKNDFVNEVENEEKITKNSQNKILDLCEMSKEIDGSHPSAQWVGFQKHCQNIKNKINNKKENNGNSSKNGDNENGGNYNRTKSAHTVPMNHFRDAGD